MYTSWINFDMKKSKIADLPNGVGVTRNSNGTVSYWRVRLGKKFTGGGIVTKNFRGLSEARSWIFGEAQDLKASGVPVVELKRIAGSAAFELSSKRITEATIAFKKCDKAGISLSAAVDYAIKHMKPAVATKTLREVTEFVISNKQSNGASPRHLDGMRSIFGKVCADLGKHNAHEITREMLEDWQSEQDDVSLNTRISYARHLHIAFNEAVERGWCIENPTNKLKRTSESHGDPEIWTPTYLARVLAVALKSEKAALVGLAIKAFAGVRTSELMHLRWERVSRNKIQIVGKSSKTRRSRGIPIQLVLAKWLADFRKPEGPVMELSLGRWFDAIQRITKAAEVPNPSNVLRHSFGTYRYHATKSEDETSYEMGNTPAVVLTWYRSVAAEDHHVRQWWKLTPEFIERWSRRFL